MYLFPIALHIEQLHMKTLIAVFLWCVDIVYYRARALLEVVGQYGIDMQTDFLLFLQIVRFVNDADIMFAVDMMEVATFSLHLAPDAVRLAHTQFDTCFNAVADQYLLSLGYKCVDVVLLLLLQSGQLLLNFSYFKLIQYSTIREDRIKIHNDLYLAIAHAALKHCNILAI